MAGETDPYAYLNREGFTSEKFKVEISNLPKYLGMGQFKKFLAKEGFVPHKIKPMGRFAYVCFKDDMEKEKAIEKLNGVMFRGSKLEVKIAKPMKDPLVKKRKFDEVNSNVDDDKESVPISQKIENVTLPYQGMPLSEQHSLKKKYVEDVFNAYKNELKHANRSLFQSQDGNLCPIEDTVASPVDEHYRNKCDFTIGINPENSLATVGFRLASYKKGACSVGPIAHLSHLPLKTIEAVAALEEFVRKSEHAPYNPEDHTGIWKNVVIRTSDAGQMMAILVMHPQNFEEKALVELKKGIQDFVVESGIFTSFFVQFQGAKKSNDDVALEKLSGDDFISEKLCDLEFRISPLAFFQVNTKAAEVLYRLVGDIANVNLKSILLDICCGTGTIGLSLAKRCKKVYGIELIPSAIEDATYNAKANAIENCEFIAGRAEEKISRLLDGLREEDEIIAVVDPPRAGLHQKCTQALRRASKIRRLVYISCDAKCAMKSFVDLSRATSNTYSGDPFVPKRAIPVDLFPNTSHCETVILFER
ncbi:tRNA (uracil-5-)-methyltransferase homolog A-like [Artemia franciscana]|nr:hypothetical protein QYM36_000339 [Artemia franciscana]KAK2725829.1 hypothetical protein QYM36_000339 [Artemia franciscana]KAK2725831.1 hypothetical protein QYM36_000339 [Artemia franciscana]KAK2725832.1 hypothetical protein QYM36_000339 [Artemia franciscana]